MVKGLRNGLLGAACVLLCVAAQAAELSGDAKAAIPEDVQQIVVVDYRAMQNSPAAMNLKDRVLPPELKRFDTALRQSGLKIDQDADTLAFVAFRTNSPAPALSPSARNSAQSLDTPILHTRMVGIAQGQFNTAHIQATWAKNKTKPTMIRSNAMYPMGSAGMSMVFLNQTTMVFGDQAAVRAALDARDGITPNFLNNSDMVNEMASVDSRALWSLLDQKGTQTMMQSVLGPAASLTDYDSVKNRMKSSRYTMDFSNGVKFDMAVVMSDTMTAATAAALMNGLVLMRKTQGDAMEKAAMDDTTVDSSSGTLKVSYSASDSQFSELLNSSLFQQVVR